MFGTPWTQDVNWTSSLHPVYNGFIQFRVTFPNPRYFTKQRMRFNTHYPIYLLKMITITFALYGNTMALPGLWCDDLFHRHIRA